MITSSSTGSRPEDVKRTNLQVVLQEIIRRTANGQPPSRANIAEATAITRATTSRICDELLHNGFILEQEKTVSTQPGRPATPLIINPDRFVGIGIDINVSHLYVCSLNLRGERQFSYYQEFSARCPQPEQLLSQLGKIIDQYCQANQLTADRIAGATIAVPGLVDPIGRSIVRTPNLAWDGICPSDLFHSEYIRQPPVLVNEADAASVATAFDAPGCLGRLSEFIYISGEIGVGGTIVTDHQRFRGNRGWSGEVGHLCVNPDGPACSCGSTGCLEQYLGRRAMSTNCGFNHLATNEDLLRRFFAGDSTVRDGFQIAGRALGLALVSLVNTLDIRTVVLGGVLSSLVPILAPIAQETLAKRLMLSQTYPVEIITDRNEAKATAMGGALMALNRIIENPAAYC